MIIEKNFQNYTVSYNSILKDILFKIDNNKSKIVFVVDAASKVIGSISDGDIRRYMIVQSKISFSIKASEICNPIFKYIKHDESPEKIKIMVNGKINIAPIVDNDLKIIAIAKKRPENFRIQNFTIGEKFPTFIIAEIGNNHNGDINIAKKMVDLAKDTGADCVKFQMRNLNTLYRNNSKSSSENEDLGSQYVLSLLEKFQLSNSDLFRVFDYASKKNILPLCTAWDIESVENLENYGLPAYKVASADFVNHDLLLRLSETRKPLICSTGMTKESEIIRSINYLQDLGCHYSLLHCNSTYPAAFKDINLKYLNRLAELGKCVVGYSGHERGYNIPLASVGLGARIIEKHFTIDKEMEGNDHVVSLLPEEFRQMVNGIREIEISFGTGSTKILSQGEIINREVLGKSLVINCDLPKGKVIESEMIEVRSPGTGVEPYRKKEIIGKIATRNFKKNDFFFQSDIDNNLAIEPRNYKFNRPWGVPVRYHDVDNLINKASPDLVEFHLSYKDLELNPKNYLLRDYDIDLVVHAPELFANDHILDLSSENQNYRGISIKNLQKTIDVTRSIREFFPKCTKDIPLVLNAGGATLNAPVAFELKNKMY
ncbi:MAG: CBS domain-containing protein, partial [Flavobacteriaceae bacterium]|nr:CBS domain-containing protein [Flavobacteriaceae bacterium]